MAFPDQVQVASYHDKRHARPTNSEKLCITFLIYKLFTDLIYVLLALFTKVTICREKNGRQISLK